MPTVLVRVLCVSLASVLFLVAGCSSPDKVLAPQQTGTGIALLKILAASNSPFSRIAHSATTTVSASDMLTITSNLTVTDSSVEGTITGIPAGKNRLFSVAVYDSLDTLQYRGSATFDVKADTSVVVALSVSRVSGSAIINGTVNEGDSIPTIGLLAYYPFNGNPNDASGNSRHGIAHAVTLSADRFGNANAAYSFNGSNSYIDCGANFGNIVDTATFCVWVKSPATSCLVCESSTMTRGILVSQRNSSGSCPTLSIVNTWPSGLGIEKGNVIFWADKAGHTSANMAVTPQKVNDDQWHLVCGVKKGSIYSVFVDGVFADSATDATILSSTDNLFIGHQRALNTYFQGQIDDVRIYRKALTEEQIGALYREGGWIGN